MVQKKLHIRDRQNLRHEAYFTVRYNNEGCRITKKIELFKAIKIER